MVAEKQAREYLGIKAYSLRVRECKVDIKWNDNEFWADIPAPMSDPLYHQNNTIKTINNLDCYNDNFREQTETVLQKIRNIQSRVKEVKKCNKINKTTNKNKFLRTYFCKWKLYVMTKKEKEKLKAVKEKQKEKLELFIGNLKKNTTNEINCENNQHQSENKSNSITHNNTKTNNEKSKNNIKETAIFKNRFEAQEVIIKAQKNKLEEQNKLIEDLTLGIIKEEIIKNAKNTKVSIQEIFAKCSNKVKCRIQPQLEYVESERDTFMVSSQKAPKLVQQMEERAIERARRRQIITERRCLIEEQRERIMREALESKTIRDEQERQHDLQMIIKKRKKELEAQKIRQINKKKFLIKLKTAEDFYNEMLTRRYFFRMKSNYFEYKNNIAKAERHYRTKILRKSLQKWDSFIEMGYESKYLTADTFYNFQLMSRAFQCLLDLRMNYVRKRQVAEDIYDFRLQINVFMHWKEYVRIQNSQTDKKIIVADNYFKRRLLFQCFHQWKSLPVVLQLEKVQEEKKRKWREKVWEVVPDYEPPSQYF